jgi:hypothetical protein
MRARRCNFAKTAAIFQKRDEARFSMSVTSRLSVSGGVENINARGGRYDCSCAQPLRARGAAARASRPPAAPPRTARVEPGGTSVG